MLMCQGSMKKAVAVIVTSKQVALEINFNLLTGYGVYVRSSIVPFKWVWCTIMFSIFRC
jgi:hypothetical protein